MTMSIILLVAMAMPFLYVLQGMTTSMLRLPLSMAYQSYAATDGSATCRAPADGGQIDSPFGKEEDKLQKMK